MRRVYTCCVLQKEFRQEVLRINQRYLIEIVEAFDFCPWAKQVRGTEKLRREVFFEESDSDALLSKVSQCVEEISEQERVEIGLLIFPNLPLGPREFRGFVANLERSHAESHPRGQLPLAMASFHPVADADLQTPARLVPFIRRSPDPTIQLVRRSTMASVRKTQDEGSVFADSLESFLPLLGKTPTLSTADSIAKNNLRTVERESIAAIEVLLKDIREDRARTYRRFVS